MPRMSLMNWRRMLLNQGLFTLAGVGIVYSIE